MLSAAAVGLELLMIYLLCSQQTRSTNCIPDRCRCGLIGWWIILHDLPQERQAAAASLPSIDAGEVVLLITGKHLDKGGFFVLLHEEYSGWSMLARSLSPHPHIKREECLLCSISHLTVVSLRSSVQG